MPYIRYSVCMPSNAIKVKTVPRVLSGTIILYALGVNITTEAPSFPRSQTTFLEWPVHLPSPISRS